MNRLLIISVLCCTVITSLEQTGTKDEIKSGIRSDNEYYSSTTNFTDSVLFLDEEAENSSIRRKASLKNGIYQGFYDNGEMQFSAMIRKNHLQGIWQSWYPNGILCDSGKFIKNAPDGEWKGWYPNGKLRYVWNFNATKYFSLKDEMANQPKQKFFKIAQLPLNQAIQYYQTDYIFGQRTRTPGIIWRSKTAQHQIFDPILLKSKVYKNTVINSYVPPFPECLFHGSFIAYYHDGRIMEKGNYVNGMRDGLWEEYSRDGKKSIGSYRYGKKNGEWRKYSAHGKLLTFQRFNASGIEKDSYDFSGEE